MQPANRKPIKVKPSKGSSTQQPVIITTSSSNHQQNNSESHSPSPLILSPTTTGTNNYVFENEGEQNEQKTNKKIRAKRTGGILGNFFDVSKNLNENTLNQMESKMKEIIESRNLFKENNLELCEMIMSADVESKNESISQQEILKIDLINRQMAELESFETNLNNFIQSNGSSGITNHLVNAVNTRNAMRNECMNNLNEVTNLLGETLESMKNDIPVERIQKIDEIHSKILLEEDVLSVSGSGESFNMYEFNRRSKEYFEWVKKSSPKLIIQYKETKAVFKKFLEAMEKELNLMKEVKEEEKKMMDNFEYIITYTPEYLEAKRQTTAEPSERKTHIKELHSYYLKRKIEMESKTQLPLKPDLESVNLFYNQLNSLKTDLREAKRNHLKLKFEKENHELDGVSQSILQISTQKVQEASEVVHRIEEKIQLFESNLEKSIKLHPEILIYINSFSKNDDLIPISIKDTKLEVKRSIKDYEILKIINPRVCKAKFANQISIIKQYSFSDSKSRKEFMKEVQILHKMNHPCIVKIEAYFCENDFVFIQMEHKGDLTLADWLLKSPSEYEKRNVFHSVAQTLKYVHDFNIIHCDIKPENIIMSPIGSKSIGSVQEIYESYRPILIDFDISVDKNSLQNSLAIRSTLTYLAPEVVHAASTGADFKSVLNTSIDVWSFGVMMFKAYYPNDEVLLLPNEHSVRIPEHENQYLQDLLSNILQRDAKDRPCAEDIYSHIYFNSSIMNELVSQKQIVSTEDKMQSFNRFLHHYKKRMQRNTSDVIQIRMRRDAIVGHTLQAFSSMEINDLLLRLQVQFVGEIGMDLGGITSNMYTEFFRQSIQNDHNIFECGSSSKTGGYLPKADAPVEVCESIGKILIKTIYDQRVIPEVLSPFIFKFLSHKYSSSDPDYNSLQVTFRDLEQFDESMARSLRMLLTHEGVHEWEISFDGLGQDSNRMVNDQNKHDYVKMKMRNVLLLSRLEQLKAIRKGFNSLVELQPQLALFSWKELMLLCCGKDYIDVKSVIDLLKFKDFPTNSRTPLFFTQFISSLSSIQLRQFIEFSTGQCGISYGWQSKALSITVQYSSSSVDSLPVSHICSFILDLPDYNNYQLLETKIKQAFEFTSSSGFYIA
ncbi:predicted protein [Naegleria gruberi]|uniref:Predicted protein n=1 Tax=Naegleria gruberi TaxID=5762 RepID=D2V9C7_NAEGR|nr:uncharacterized protein NAEGRDRAFT_65394 [Naegleria gruberi]EFC46436.1 predicted protein [Naegleria gruberi]|eukprot:XP_002679180.1 predicted protein [Naegleria gruberi strain NEG-M]